jgi:hypothetical protein
MRKVERKDILSIEDYEKARPAVREKMMKIKNIRRVHVGQYLTFLFENFETVRYQIQEMMRAEQMTGEQHIAHEIQTYNELIGEQGELGCTLLIEIDDSNQRAELLSRWLELPKNIYLKTKDGTLIKPVVDDRQIGDDRISSVHYLRFKVGDQIPVAVGCNLTDLKYETALTPEQSLELCRDVMAR